MRDEWQQSYLHLWGTAWSGVFIRASRVPVDARLGGVGGSTTLRAIRAVSSASHVIVLAL